MTAKDPSKTLRNKQIAQLTEQINCMLEEVIELTGYEKEQSLNAKYGGKYAEYIDIKHEVIDTSEQFIALYLRGFVRTLEEFGDRAVPGHNYYDAYLHVRDNPRVMEWLKLFLTRTYLRNYEALSKVRPRVEDAEIWIGQKNASYGIFVTPRFANGVWENDKSEIRHFKPQYWSIGHILDTGFVIPDREAKIEFGDVEEYLKFFQHVIVRNSGSLHEQAIAERYSDFVLNCPEPECVPLLIPELRYGGKSLKHEHRLDFTVIDPHTLAKVGFELSPWSTHGELEGIKGKTQKEVNEMALRNFEREMTKLKAYFRKWNIPVIVYTDTDLKNYDAIFEQIADYLAPERIAKQLQFDAMEEFMSFKK